MSHFRFLFNYLNYYITSKNKHGVHSPFVYKLVAEVFNAKTPKNISKPIEQKRSQLKQNNNTIELEDFGAKPGVYKRTVSEIAKRSLKPKKYAQLLQRIIAYHQPKTAIELGTSLGISTLYQAAGMNGGELYTLEGSNEVMALAQEGFDTLESNTNITPVIGNFDNTLPEVLAEVKEVDYVFFDGNHRKAPTLQYFEQCLTKAHSNSVFIFDDINWSGEMQEAWEEIKKHPRVTVTIDLFFIGIVYFRKEQEKEHFKIRF